MLLTNGISQTFPQTLDSLSKSALMNLKIYVKNQAFHKKQEIQKKFESATDSLSLVYQKEQSWEERNTHIKIEKLEKEAELEIQELKSRAERSFRKVDFSMQIQATEEKFMQKIDQAKKEGEEHLLILSHEWQSIFEQHENFFTSTIQNTDLLLAKQLKAIDAAILSKTKVQ